ncbi:helix-turn-helix transcriptional regulator [Enterococcus timonensis]|uniref:helix-turn-helix transcriptional regulator n=1 Tax=Enterococcus timonensis TaxID=1852364 RepID=UPI0008DAB00C|nr:helix-turn-helix transcriptional regulator [Enterococcus timonensis]
MIFEQLMFDSSQQVRFNIFRLLTTLTPAHYSIDDIGQKMNLTYQQVYHHLRELNREIIEIEPEHPAILIKNHGVDSRLLSLSIDVYRYHLLKESLPFFFYNMLLMLTIAL